MYFSRMLLHSLAWVNAHLRPFPVSPPAQRTAAAKISRRFIALALFGCSGDFTLGGGSTIELALL
jgi:hypothetical protein